MLQMVLDKITLVDRKVDRGFEEVKGEIVKNGKRIDKLGIQLAELEDDAPTREEHDGLEKRVGRLEKQVSSN